MFFIFDQDENQLFSCTSIFEEKTAMNLCQLKFIMILTSWKNVSLSWNITDQINSNTTTIYNLNSFVKSFHNCTLLLVAYGRL